MLARSPEFNVIAWEGKETGELHMCDDGVIVEILKDGRPAAAGMTVNRTDGFLVRRCQQDIEPNSTARMGSAPLAKRSVVLMSLTYSPIALRR